MRLLLPEFDITDIQSRTPNSQSAVECPSADDQPCCSKDLRDDTSAKQGSKERRNGAGEKGVKDNGMAEEKEEENGKEAVEGDENMGEEEEEDEEEADSEEDADESELFIRSSGLISHSYSLDLNLSPGK